MKANEINVRDPFIILENGKYYLYGTRGADTWGNGSGFDVYVSDDLIEWSEPKAAFERYDGFWADKNFWAPEVHKYKGEYYMFASFKSECRERGTQILKAATPEGPFMPISDGPVTPPEWSCLDGTFYLEDEIPYMIFCHEWTQIVDGEMCVVRLSDDLTHAVGEPRTLFKASDMPSVKNQVENGYVTDGPFLHRNADGRLIMIWSSYDEKGYIEIVSYSDNGSIHGNWLHCEKPLSAENGGHGMLFYDKDGNFYFTMHSPNAPSRAERVRLFSIKELQSEPFLEFI